MAAPGEQVERAELAVTLQRAAHGGKGRGVAQAQGREAVAEVGEVHVALVVFRGLHAADCTTAEGSAAMVMRDTCPDSRRISL